MDALKDKSKGIKKWHAKLKSEYGRDEDDSDSESELKEPREDEDWSYEQHNSAQKKIPKGKGRSRRGKPRSLSTILKMKMTRNRKKQPKPAEPEVIPFAQSELEFEGLIYKVGDIVKVLSVSGEKTFAQIQGFYNDQFCGKYVNVRWLILNIPLQNKNTDFFNPASFVEGPVHHKPVNMKSIEYVMRVPSSSMVEQLHKDKLVYGTNSNKPQSMDNPSFVLSSVDHKWYQLIY